jgi:hypothetical protein
VLAAQCDLINLLQIIIILVHCGVQPRDLVAFLAPVPAPSASPSPSPAPLPLAMSAPSPSASPSPVQYPAPHLNLPPLDIPKGYENCVVGRDGALSDEVDRRLGQFFKKKSVGRIVFIYANHGSKAGLGLGAEALDRTLLKSWVRRAVDAKKRFLVVLNSCRSTYVAEAIWRDLIRTDGQNPKFLKRLAANVGFLTSSDVDCCTSRILISEHPELVYLFGTTAVEGYAPGFRSHNTMFLRALLLLWTYQLSNPKLPLRELPGLMNSPGNERAAREAAEANAEYFTSGAQTPPAARSDALADELERKRGSLFYGFDAAFVGAAGPDALGDLDVNLFFPLAQVTRKTPVACLPGRQFEQVVPAEELGDLFDDVEGCDATMGNSFGVLVLVRGHVGVLVRRAQGRLDPVVFGGRNAIIDQAFYQGGADDEKARVPWGEFVKACYGAMRPRWRPNMRLHPGSVRRFAMEDFLSELNGKIPSRYDGFVFWMTLYQYQVGEQTGFQDEIRKAYHQLEAEFPPESTP